MYFKQFNRMIALSLFLSLSLIPSLTNSQTVTGSGDANAIAKWIQPQGGGGGDLDSGVTEGDVTEITTTTLYYVGSNFGIHTSTPGSPLMWLEDQYFKDIRTIFTTSYTLVTPQI